MDSHTYYVSVDEVLVHNGCDEVPDSLKEGEADTDVEAMGNIVTLVEKITPHHNRMKCRMVARRRNQWLRYVQGETEIEHMEKMEFVAEILFVFSRTGNYYEWEFYTSGQWDNEWMPVVYGVRKGNRKLEL